MSRVVNPRLSAEFKQDILHDGASNTVKQCSLAVIQHVLCISLATRKGRLFVLSFRRDLRQMASFVLPRRSPWYT